MNSLPFINLSTYSFSEEAVDFIQLFYKSDRKKYVFGKNQYAKSFIGTFKVSGIIDEYTNETEFEGVPIFSNLSSIDDSALVVVCSMVNTISVLDRLSHLKVKCLDYLSFLKLSKSKKLKDHIFNIGFLDYYYSKTNEFLNLFNLFCDQESKDTFLKIINYRLSYDIKFLHNIKSSNQQYWEDFLQLNNHLCFIDIGCFDGQNSLEFIERYPAYSSVIAFEPMPLAFSKCQENLRKYYNVKTCQIALGFEEGDTVFIDNECSSRQDPQGNIAIQSKKLDSIIKIKPVSYIKIDSEGSELSIIKGARNTILKNHPTLAICLYHQPSDFITIPNEILSINANYKLYLRHYSDCINETVLYCILH